MFSANQLLFSPTGSYIPFNQHLVSKWPLFIRIGNSPNPCKQSRRIAQELGKGHIWPNEKYTPWRISPGGPGRSPGMLPVPGGYIRRLPAILPG